MRCHAPVLLPLLMLWVAATRTPGQAAQAEQAASTRSPEASADATVDRTVRRARGKELYATYCTECHGTRGEGHVADHANSLRSRSFVSTVSSTFLDSAIRYGRPGTAMAAYHQALGGPLTDANIADIGEYIRTFAEVEPVKLGKPRTGDADRGARVYRERCESCHGHDGRGVEAPSLNDPLFLLTASEPFLRYAISEGREGTTMPAFRDVLSAQEIEDVTAHVQRWSRRWIRPAAVRVVPTDLSAAVVNPEGSSPQFGPLRDDLFVTVAALKDALDRKSRIVLLDARTPSAWAVGHISGAVPLPYFEAEQKALLLPKDGTWIVAYCECPTALAKRVVTTLRQKGFEHTAVLDEGLLGWVGRRFPVTSGVVNASTP